MTTKEDVLKDIKKIDIGPGERSKQLERIADFIVNSRKIFRTTDKKLKCPDNVYYVIAEYIP